ncbi:MAG: DUF349 domain-containing protein [Flavobacteriales bacterium]
MLEQENTPSRQNLIAQLQELVKTEQQIGKAIQQKKTIMEAWAKLGDDGSSQNKQLSHHFFKLVEDFNYNINIYKAIQDHDLKRNQQLKEELLKKLEDLSTKNDRIGDTFKELQKQWFDVGPVKKELRDDFWQKFKDLSQIIIYKLAQLKVQSKAKEEENALAKEQIILFLENIISEPITKEKQWRTKTDIVIAKQAEWKEIGHVPKEKSNSLWNRYRAACDNFFKEKAVFYDSLKAGFQQHKKEKLELCDAAQNCINDESKSNDDKAFTLTKLQRKWRELGQAHPRDEQKLWIKFHDICNSFFNTVKQQKEEEKANNLAALDNKKEMLNNIDKLTTKEDIVAQLKQWYLSDIIKTPHELNNKFFEKINTALVNQQLNKNEIEELKFNTKLEAYHELKIDDLFGDEISQIREKIKSLEEDKIKFENNLGFFKHAKNDNPMIVELREKVTQMTADIDVYKKKLQMIKKAMKYQA